MFNKLYKIIKDTGLPTLGAVLALVLVMLLLVPEVQSGETGAKKYTRENSETGAKKYVRESSEIGAKKFTR